MHVNIYTWNEISQLLKRTQSTEVFRYKYTMNHVITPSVELMKHYKPEEYKLWYEAAIQENTPDYQHKYWGI